jgi:hypothetical protein
MGARVQLRDYEILRTLARLRFVTTRELVNVFFSSPSVGRRRLNILWEAGWITPHTKGLTDPWGFRCWRLTTEGIDTVSHSFRDEVLADGLADRLVGTSLFNIQHRMELNRLYFRLLADPSPARGTAADRDGFLRRLRSRATAFSWKPDGDAVYRFDYKAESHQLVPDAVLIPNEARTVFFLELDRSTKVLRRIRDNFDRYALFFRDIFPTLFQSRTPVLVYVVPSKARRAGVQRQGEASFGSAGPFRAETLADAVSFLRSELRFPKGPDEATQAPIVAGLPSFPLDVARDLYRALHALAEQHPDVREHSTDLLHRAHRALTQSR